MQPRRVFDKDEKDGKVSGTVKTFRLNHFRFDYPQTWRQNRESAFFVLVRPRCDNIPMSFHEHPPNVKKVFLLFYLHTIFILVRLCRFVN